MYGDYRDPQRFTSSAQLLLNRGGSNYLKGSRIKTNYMLSSDINNSSTTLNMGNTMKKTSSRGNSPVPRRKISSSNSASSIKQSQAEHSFENKRCTLHNSLDTEIGRQRYTTTVASKYGDTPLTRRNSGDSGYNSSEKASTSGPSSEQNSSSTSSCSFQSNDKCGKRRDPFNFNDGIIDLDKRNKDRANNKSDSRLLSRGQESVLLHRRRENSLNRESLSGRLRGTGLTDNDNKTRPYINERSMISRSPKGCSDGLVGLQNLGNTCFMNSILQCLSHCKPLRDKLITTDSMQSNSQSKMKGKLISTFVGLIRVMWSKQNKSEIALSPHSFKLQIQRFAPRFVGYDQQDSQEFLRFLLDGLHEDLNQGNRRRSSRTSPDLSKLSEKNPSEYAWEQYKSRDDSLVTDLFCGQMMSTLTCSKCNHRSVTFDPFWDLSLPIPRHSDQHSSRRFSDSCVTLVDCLMLFTKKEDLDGDEKPKCDKCKVRQKCQKQFTIQMFPRVLVLHLKRFSGFGFRSKLQIDVDFPLNNLDMSQFASHRSDSRAVKYNLFAVSNHSGSTYGGHYTAYCKHSESKEWHSFNDSRVGALSNSSVRGSQAYVLFYEMEDFENSKL